jgi:hypothetical protein
VRWLALGALLFAVVLAGCGGSETKTETKTTTAQSSAQAADQSAGAQSTNQTNTTAAGGSAIDQQAEQGSTGGNTPGGSGTSTTTNPAAASGADIEGQGTELPDSSVVAPAEDQGAAPADTGTVPAGSANQGSLEIPSRPAREDLTDIKVRECVQGQAATITGVANVTGSNSADNPAATDTTSTDESAIGNQATGGGNVFGSFRYFAANSPWNVRVDTLPAAPNTNQLVRNADERQTVNETRSGAVIVERRRLGQGIFINTCRWTDPVVDAANGVPTPVSCRQILCGSDAGIKSLNIPSDESPDPRYDGWFTILDRANNVAWDMWRARRERDRSISYQFIRKWRLNGPGFLKPGNPSARGSGLPLFAGLITPQELKAGQINHALAMSVPGPAQRLYVQPASRTDGVGRLESLPEGARVRLRAGARFRPRKGTNRRAFQAIMNALKTYGAIIVDRAAVPTLYAQKNASYRGLLPGNALQGIKLSDFQVISLGTRYADPPVQTGNVLLSPVALQPAGATAAGG